MTTCAVVTCAVTTTVQVDPPLMVGSVVLEPPRKQLVNAPLSSEPSPSTIENKVASLQVSVHPSFLMHLNYVDVPSELRSMRGLNMRKPREHNASVQ